MAYLHTDHLRVDEITDVPLGPVVPSITGQSAPIRYVTVVKVDLSHGIHR